MEETFNTYPETFYYGIQGRLFIHSVNYPRRFGVLTPKRGEVQQFSEASRRRLRKYLRCARSKYTVFITLTWPADRAPRAAESTRCLKAWFERVRRLNEKRSFQDWSMVWIREFTRRGTIHFHIAANCYLPKRWLSVSWWEICGKISEKHLKAGTRIEAFTGGNGKVSRYFAKYFSKTEQKEVPPQFRDGPVGKFWGVAGCRRQVSAAICTGPSRPGGREGKNWAEALAEIQMAKTSFEKCGLLNCFHQSNRVMLWWCKDEATAEALRVLIDRQCDEIGIDRECEIEELEDE